MKRAKIYAWMPAILFFMCFTNAAVAQYEYIRNPQTPEEIALMKQNKVIGERDYSISDDLKKAPLVNKAYDPWGRLVISMDYYHRQYYIYDDKNNVVSFLDSGKTEFSYVPSEYKFTYDADGYLKTMTGPNQKSTFQFDPATRTLNETLVRNDTTFHNRYIYDDKKRLVDALVRDADGKPSLHLMKNYGPDGRLFNEVVSKSTPASNDSALTVYEYNDKKQLYKKERFRFQNFYFNTNGAKMPNRSATHYEVATYEYNLDDKGRPLEEQFSIKDDKLSSRYSSWKYNDKGLMTEETVRIGHNEPQIITREYLYGGN